MINDAEARRARRPDPRLGIALAGAGCGLAVVGVLAIAGDALGGGGDSGDDGSQLPGILLSLGVLAAGVLLLLRAPVGPLRTAGSVASVLAIPAIVFFLSFDDSNAFEPFSGDAVVMVSAVVWLAWHFVGPAAGRTFPLAAGLIAAWLALLQIVEPDLSSPLDLVSYGYLVLIFGFSEPSEIFGGSFGGPDTDAVAITSLLAGAAAVVIGRRLDRAGQLARSTAFAAAAVAILFVGSLFLVGSLDPVGAGIALAVIGAVLAGDGATRQRRGTTWSGAVFVVVGLGYALLDVADDSATSFGVAAAIAGAGVVIGGHFLTAAFGEPGELTPGPSTFTVGGGRPIGHHGSPAPSSSAPDAPGAPGGQGDPAASSPSPAEPSPWAPPTEPPTQPPIDPPPS